MIQKRLHRVLARLALTSLLGLGAVMGGWNAYAQGDAIARADALMKENRPAEAYALLAPLEDQFAGNPDYDYLLGISALDSGRVDKATLAFERVLAVRPNFSGARLDMARAYFLLGDLARARSEFETVLKQDPPEAARQTITRYLSDIETAERAARRTIRLHLEYALGHDTNINNSTGQSTINIPALGNLAFTLNATNVKRPDTFNHLQAGVDYFQKVDPGFSLLAGLQWRLRDNMDSDTFDAENLELRGGAVLGDTGNQVTIVANYGRYKLDSALNRHVDGIGGEWRYALNPQNQLSAFAQYARTRFASVATDVNSFDASTWGLSWLRILGEGRAAINSSIFMGDERDVNRRADGAKSSLGLRVGGMLQLRGDLELFSSMTFQNGDYDRQNAAFLATRQDDTSDFSLGLAWRFMKDWTFRPQITHTRNSSNIPIYQFKRTETMFLVRRDFNL